MDALDSDPEDGLKPAAQGATKKPYTQPRLVKHGRVVDLTQGGKAGSSDIGGLTATGV